MANEKQITMEDLQIVEHVVRKDPKVIQQCIISGIPAEDMHKVYCDREFLSFPPDQTLLINEQLGQLATITDSEAMFDFSKLSCTIAHI